MEENDSRTESWRRSKSNRKAARDPLSYLHGYDTLLKSNLHWDREKVAEEKNQILQGALLRQFGLAITSVFLCRIKMYGSEINLH
jgi:hypothetical protein